ncbi:glycosyltransferase [bacterium]|nr:glycosyltransferase [bacterium]
MNTSQIRKAFLLLILVTPFIDLLNATVVRGGINLGSIGQITKGIIAILGFLLLNKKQKNVYLAALGLGGVLSLLHLLIQGGQPFTNFVNDIIFVVKITYIIPLAFLFAAASKRFLIVASSVAWVTIMTNIVLGLLGYGYTQYAVNYGYKGFFFSGNEMALALIATSAILLYVLYEQKKITLAVAFSVVLLFLGPVQGMKTLLLGLPFVAIATPLLLYGKRIIEHIQEFSKKKKQWAIVGVIGIVVAAVGILYMISPQFFIRFGEIYKRSGFVSAVLSERDKYLEIGWKIYTEHNTLPQKLFGVGERQAQENMLLYRRTTKTIEMDFFDLLFTFGFVTLLYYWLWITFIIHHAKQPNLGSHFVVLINILLMSLSLLTGHAVYSTFFITYWAMLNAFGRSTSKTRVFFVGSIETGGISTYMRETAKHAKKLDIEVISSHTSGPIYNTLLLFTKNYFDLLFKLLSRVVQGQRSILHLHMATGGSFVRKLILLYTLSWFADKTFLHFHSGKTTVFLKKIESLPLGHAFLRLTFALPDGMITVSQTLATGMKLFLEQSGMNYDRSKWYLLQNAIDVPSNLPKSKKFSTKEKLTILIVSRLNAVKNLTIVPKIARLLVEKDLNFEILIAGDGPEKSAIQAAIIQEKVTTEVKLLGELSHNKLEPFYKKSHLFLLPSNYESFGLVILEGYVHGLPAVTSNIGGLIDIVENGKTGIRCQLDNPQAFADAIITIATTPKLLETMSKNSLIAVNQYDYKEHVEQLFALYRNA